MSRTDNVGSASAKGTLLVVDDEEDVLGVVTEYLSAQGYRVVTASSGREAMESLRVATVPFDVAVIDWTLPDVAGDDLVQHIREVQPRCPILLTTGHSDDVLADAMFGDLVASIVRKPFTMRALATQVETLLLESSMHEPCHDF
ncbi:MAG: response regulator [Myxococcota bacterium]